MLSPFRYPGGKSRLAPAVVGVAERMAPGGLLLEPFAGGASVGLAAAAAGLPAHLVELDARVATFWAIALGPERESLCLRVEKCDPQAVWTQAVRGDGAGDPVEVALAALVQNRLAFGGNMTSRPGAIVVGDRGKGALSRWYPATLASRIRGLAGLPLSASHGCAFDAMRTPPANTGFAFIDPPYRQAGRRLYAHRDVDLDALLVSATNLPCPWLLTYEDTEEAREALGRHGVAWLRVGLLGNSGQVRPEIVAGPWLALCHLVEVVHAMKKAPVRLVA